MEKLQSERKLLLQACITPSLSLQKQYAAQWESLVSIDDLDYASMRLIPLFLHKNQLAGIETRHDKRLKVIHKYWWLKTKHIYHQLRVIHNAFIKEGIHLIVIKGASIQSYYQSAVLRPMADLDVLISISEISTALIILKKLGYSVDDKVEAALQKDSKLVTDFIHSIECRHLLNGIELDLHWRIGSLCSHQFTFDLRSHLEACKFLPGSARPQLAYEVFMIIIHAVVGAERDNLNWIIDIAVLTENMTDEFWDTVRSIAVKEKKVGYFEYGCSLLLSHGVYAPEPLNASSIRVPFYFPETAQRTLNAPGYILRLNNLYLHIKYLYPYANLTARCYQAIRRIRLFVAFRKPN